MDRASSVSHSRVNRIDHSPPARAPSCPPRSDDDNASTEMALLKQCMEAISQGDLQAVGQAIKDGVSFTLPDAHGDTILGAAAAIGNSEIFECLLAAALASAPDFDIDQTNSRGETPLMVAAIYGHQGVAELLTRAGASIDIATDNGYTVLMLAAQHNHADILELLLHVFWQRGLANPPSMASNDHQDSDLVAATLHTAMKKLIDQPRIVNRVAAPDQFEQESALLIAVRNNHCDAAEVFMVNGADTDLKKLGQKESLLGLCLQRNFFGLAEIFLEWNLKTAPDDGLLQTHWKLDDAVALDLANLAGQYLAAMDMQANAALAYKLDFILTALHIPQPLRNDHLFKSRIGAWVVRTASRRTDPGEITEFVIQLCKPGQFFRDGHGYLYLVAKAIAEVLGTMPDNWAPVPASYGEVAKISGIEQLAASQKQLLGLHLVNQAPQLHELLNLEEEDLAYFTDPVFYASQLAAGEVNAQMIALVREQAKTLIDYADKKLRESMASDFVRQCRGHSDKIYGYGPQRLLNFYANGPECLHPVLTFWFKECWNTLLEEERARMDREEEALSKPKMFQLFCRRFSEYLQSQDLSGLLDAQADPGLIGFIIKQIDLLQELCQRYQSPAAAPFQKAGFF